MAAAAARYPGWSMGVTAGCAPCMMLTSTLQLSGQIDSKWFLNNWVISSGSWSGTSRMEILAFEGLNHGGWQDNNMIVVLNDNCMSIDPNVGALKDYLTDITTSHTYNRVKDEVWQLLGKVSKFGPDAQTIASKTDTGARARY